MYEETQYQIRIDQTTSETFTVETGLKQTVALSPLLFNIALGIVVKETKRKKLLEYK